MLSLFARLRPFAVGAVLAALLCAAPAAAQFAGGDGTEANPYQIATVEQLQAIDSDYAAHYVLVNDIDASATKDWNGGLGFDPIGDEYDDLLQFSGVIDGNGHAVRNLRIARPAENRVGLFRELTANARVENMALVDAVVEGGQIVGSLVGVARGAIASTTVRLDSNPGSSVTGSSITGGLVGRNFGSIENSFALDLRTNGPDTTGGIAGINYGRMAACGVSGAVSGNSDVGGLAGYNSSGASINDCWASAGVTGDNTIGGLAGENKASVSNSWASGNVAGNSYVGGLAGKNESGGRISLSHAAGSVTASVSLAGGLVGWSQGRISKSYATGRVSAPVGAGGLAGVVAGKDAFIETSFASGNVTGHENYAGGLVGSCSGTVRDSYSVNALTQGYDRVGGLIGGNTGVVRRSYAVSRVDGLEMVGGLIGEGSGIVSASFWDRDISALFESAGGVGKTTAQMMQEATFSAPLTDWDFDGIWGIDEGSSYPYLLWERGEEPTPTPTPAATPTPAPTPPPTATPTPAPTPTPGGGSPIRDMIEDFYTGILGRAPSADEVDAWETGYFDYAASFDIDVRFIPREMARVFFLSEEYAARARTDAEFLSDCYHVFLQRDPSSEKLAAWLAGEWSRAQVMTLFSESDEFAARVAAMYPGMEGEPAHNLVAALYIGLLDRLVDQGGLEYFAGRVADAYASGGLNHVRAEAKQMGMTVIASDEFLSKAPSNATCVTRLYRAYLGRFPSDGETVYWVAQMDAGRETEETLVDRFASSDEFTARLQGFFQ